MMTKQKHYWVNTVSYDHVQLGLAEAFIQTDHGKNTRLKRLSAGDYVVFYSPKTALTAGERLQAFTALCHVIDDDVYQVSISPSFHPWRRKVRFIAATPAPIKPLIAGLNFISNKQKWGFPFSRGLFRIEKEDFISIAHAMKVEIDLNE